MILNLELVKGKHWNNFQCLTSQGKGERLTRLDWIMDVTGKEVEPIEYSNPKHDPRNKEDKDKKEE